MRPSASSQSSDKLMGCTEPRISTAPLRPLTRETSHGFAIADFADLVLGEPLLPWQRELVIRAMELTPDGMYRFRTVLALCGRQNGKTTLIKTVALWRLFIDGAALVMGAAQTRDVAKEAWKRACMSIDASPELLTEMSSKPRTVNGDEEIRLRGGGRYRISATTEGAGRGYSVDLLIMDEIRQQRDWKAWSALSKTTMARPRGQIWCISNAGDDQSVVLNSLRDSAIAGRDQSIGLFEWSAPDGCALDDPQAWCYSMPALGHKGMITEHAIRSALNTDPPNHFRTEILCQHVKSLDGAIDEGAWADCADPTGSIRDSTAPLYACVDASHDGQHATLAVAAKSADGRFRVETVAAWDNLEDARQDLLGIFQRTEFAAISWYPASPASAFAFEIRNAAGLTVGPHDRFGEAIELSGTEVTGLCQEFALLVQARDVRHSGDPLLDSHVHGARRYHVGDVWRFARRDAGHVDALYAAAGAVHVARKFTIDYAIGESVF